MRRSANRGAGGRLDWAPRASLAGRDDAEGRRAASRRPCGFAQSCGRRRSFDRGRSDPCSRHQQGSCGSSFVRFVRGKYLLARPRPPQNRVKFHFRPYMKVLSKQQNFSARGIRLSQISQRCLLRIHGQPSGGSNPTERDLFFLLFPWPRVAAPAGHCSPPGSPGAFTPSASRRRAGGRGGQTSTPLYHACSERGGGRAHIARKHVMYCTSTASAPRKEPVLQAAPPRAPMARGGQPPWRPVCASLALWDQQHTAATTSSPRTHSLRAHASTDWLGARLTAPRPVQPHHDSRDVVLRAAL